MQHRRTSRRETVDDALHAEPPRRCRPGKGLRPSRRLTEEPAEAPLGLERLNRLLPAADRLFQRRKRPPHAESRPDHRPGRALLLQHHRGTAPPPRYEDLRIGSEVVWNVNYRWCA